MFKKVLIANRGEIAVRIMRACREMGIESVAVYSEADRRALHVRYADEAFLLGPPPATESYLRMDALIDAAFRSGAQAIHPGYGFLAENPEFARRVKDSGLSFIGPDPTTIQLLGDKIAARQRMKQAGLPLVPGMESSTDTAQDVKRIVDRIGYPILIKAAAGGGGKGMRVVQSQSELKNLFQRARSEAKSAFGDDRIYVEKYLESPRHIEIQIMADAHGNVVHLGDRECSIQRRHQKVIEESPSPLMDGELRDRMGEAAVEAARAAGYINAGTVEFLVDQNKDFYFLEVNTRIQVEHPVTEWVTGLDLIREQFRVAEGRPLSFSSHDVSWRGSAIECRIYAEDPDNGFVPSIGTIRCYVEPSGPSIRIDSGYGKGDSVPIFYDPLVSKVIAWGRNRTEAIQKMRRALDEYIITGVKTVIPFHKKVMDHPRFILGDLSTNFISEEIERLCGQVREEPEDHEDLALLSCISRYLMDSEQKLSQIETRNRVSNWKTMMRYRNVIGK